MERSGMWGKRIIPVVLSELPCRCRSIDPTFRCASCGAEILYPFRIPLLMSSP
ncbi:hypothetical protein Barb4_04576 [Bacteroidales bacterium Barb4]|nr:hypothetical protein Barb4_04576 [Bacteroidales bacterium Barb4]